MDKYKHLKIVLLAAALTLTMPGMAQNFLSGGYQGGTHGNIKFTQWTGAVNDNWNEPGNWCPAVVPDAQDDVVIPASAYIMPEVKVNGLSCKSVTLEPGAALSIKPGYVLTVNGQEVE
jgi:hypothetical protein